MFVKMQLLLLVVLIATVVPANCFLSWFFDGNEEGDESGSAGDTHSSVTVSMSRGAAPFEMKTTDEKFLTELTTNLSPLDACHHLVVAEIQTTCSDLTEEELAKLSVQLLNCQSQAEGRTVYPCTQEMCTGGMDPTTWNAYQIVSNRARAICYSARQHQFRMKTEFTVNRLVHTTQGQLESMQELQAGQDKISKATTDTLQKMQQGQQELIVRQDTLKLAQSNVHTYIASNLRDLTREKAMIAAGNKELAAMTEGIRDKIEEATEKLENQEFQQKENHEEILEDLANIRDKAKEVWEKIDNSSKQVLEFHNETQKHYKQTLDNLQKVNSTLNYMLGAVNDMRDVLEEKLNWILSLIGGTGDKVALISTVVMHIVYFLLAALSAAFLHTPMFSRMILLILVPLNALAEIRQGQSLGFTAMSMLIGLTVAANWLTTWLYSLCCYRKVANKKIPLAIEAAHPTIQTPTGNVSNCNSNDNNTPASLVNQAPTTEAPTHDGLATPDFRKLVDILEKLYSTGALTPIVSKRPISQSGPPSSADEAQTASGRAKRRSKVPPPTPIAVDMETAVAESPRIDIVKRHLMKTLDNGGTGRVTPVKEIKTEVADFSPCPSLTSTPVKGSPRSSSRQSTPGRSFSRPVCLATTKNNKPCKNASAEGSAFCRKHQM